MLLADRWIDRFLQVVTTFVTLVIVFGTCFFASQDLYFQTEEMQGSVILETSMAQQQQQQTNKCVLTSVQLTFVYL